MHSWRFLQPTLPASLEFVTPLLGWNLPPWKFLSQSQPSFYSAVDAHALRFNGIQIEAALKARGSYDLHERHVVECYEVLERMSKNGVPLDQAALAAFKTKLEEMWKERRTALQSRIPESLKPVKQKTGYKKIPKECANLVRRAFRVKWGDLTKSEQAGIDITQFLLPGAGVSQDDTPVDVERWAKLEEFNPNSPPQMLKLIKHLGYKPGTNRKTHKPTADDETIRKVIRRCLDSKRPKDLEALTTLKLARECKQLSKVLGTYVAGWKAGADGRVHATPGFWGKMFRISWRRPNTSAVIADKNEAYIAAGFRKCVMPREGKLLVEADWRGIEAKIVGYLANDPDYIRLASLGVHDYFCIHVLYARGKIQSSDIPSLSLSDAELRVIFKKAKKQFPKDRDDAKHCVHGMAYGLGANLMATMYEMPLEEAEKLVDLYFTTFPKIKVWQEHVKNYAAEKVWLQNAFGYRMPFWEIFRWDAQRYERLLKVWKKPNAFAPDGSRLKLSDLDREWIARIQARMSEEGIEDVTEALSEFCWNLGDDAKSAISFLPRDTAAAMLREVLLRLRWLAEERILLLSTHDSLLCEIEESRLEWLANLLRTEMEKGVPELDGLSIGVEVKYGHTWDSADDADEGSMRVYEFPVSVPGTLTTPTANEKVTLA